MCTLRQRIASRSEGRHSWCPPGPNLTRPVPMRRKARPTIGSLRLLRTSGSAWGPYSRPKLCPCSWVPARRSIAEGQLIGSVPLSIERHLNDEGVDGEQAPQIQPWLTAFYLAVRLSGRDGSTPVTSDEILARRVATLTADQPPPLQVNFERVLATLHRWRSALPETGRSAASGRYATSLILRGTISMRVSAMQRAPWHAPAVFQQLTKRPASQPMGRLSESS